MSISKLKFVIVFILAFTFYILPFTSVHAQASAPTPFPAPAPIPCNPITAALPSNPEFNSLRPYQASPCQTSVAPTAKYCGNTLNLQVSINQPYVPGTPGCQTSGGTVTCNYSTSENFPVVTIDLTGANLPFLGNTEDILNSQSASESATNAQKVNEYVSWYLNGVINRAEYGDSQNTPDNLINYSGPINKLLPGIILDAQRIKSVDNVAANTNHNQIVVCAQSSILGEIANILNLNVKTQPQGCYQGNGSPAPATTLGDVYRLNDWSGQNNLSFWNTIANQVVNFVTLPLGFDPGLRNLILSSFSDHWNQREPPLPWGKDQHGQAFTDLTYQKAYSEWQGRTCAIIPVVNLLVCFDNFLVPNKYAQLFQYVPLSGTEDVKGNVSVDTSSITQNAGSEVNITNPNFSGQTPADLFYAHAVESDQLASLLQETYVAKGLPQNGSSSDISTAACNNVEVRTNKGDNLFAKQITGDLSFTAGFSCQFETDAQMIQEGKCSLVSTGKEMQYVCPAQSCTKVASIDLSTVSQSPELDDIWSRLVAGPEAIFKMIFPKTNTTGSVGQILDIPGATNITYSGSGITTSDTQLKLPHLGGIYEYFLKGIQTALRPKGYGDPIDFGQTSSTLGIVDCDQTAPDITLPKTISKQDLHNLAIQWEGGKTGDHVLECYNDVARKSLAAGISPAFTFFMWLHESGGSNYSISNQDWGINSSSVVGLTAQLNDFLELPAFYKSAYPQCFGKTRTDTEAYFDLFAVGLQNGQCVPSAGDTYTTMLNQGWSWLTTCPITSYPFSSSCY